MAVNVYGIDKFCANIESMIGYQPNIYWRSCWKFVSPLFLVIVVGSAVVSSERLSFHNYIFPNWATAMGWIFSLSSVSAVPVLFVAFLVRQQRQRKRQPDSATVGPACV